MIYIRGIYNLREYFSKKGDSFFDTKEVYEMCKEIVNKSDKYDYMYINASIELMDLNMDARMTACMDENIPSEKVHSIIKAYLTYKFNGIKFYYEYSDIDTDSWLAEEPLHHIKAKLEDDKIMVSFDGADYKEFTES